MKVKKILSSAIIGAMIFSVAPVVSNHFDNFSTVEAAKGGAKVAAPKAAPKVNLNKTPDTSKASTSESKSVSGGGKEYTPSKNAKDLQSAAPATKSTAATNSGTGFGNTLRNIGLFAGGMMLGGLIGSMFGGFGGILGDVLGLIFNGILIFAAYKGIKFLYNKFRGNKNQSQAQNTFQSQNQIQAQNKSQNFNQPIDITPPQAAKIGMDYDPKRAADHYRNS